MGTISNSTSLRSCSEYPRSRAFGCPLTGLWEIRHRCLEQGERQGRKPANGMEAAVLWPLLPGEASVGPAWLVLTNRHLCGISLNILPCFKDHELTSGLLVLLGTETPVILSTVVRESHFWQEQYWQTWGQKDSSTTQYLGKVLQQCLSDEYAWDNTIDFRVIRSW